MFEIQLKIKSLSRTNKLKIFNDPVYGFISVPDEFIFDLIEHPFFQRLRRISQTGMSFFVYPGCTHSRFLHALGCLHLMQKAVDTLRQKGVEITADEERAVYTAILLHDVGHGPFSHALESTIVEDVHHEEISLRIMEELNREFPGELSLAIQIFKKEHPKKFLSQLIAGQLDIDRLDYLKRDSFFTGVAEGNINSDRIISMLNVADNELVVDLKGIYSIEKFLTSRMFMYWQVYLHKTSFAAEIYLIQALKRAKKLILDGKHVTATEALRHFIFRNSSSEFTVQDLEIFCRLDDNDVTYSMKEWQSNPDPILSFIAKSIVQRRLPKVEIRKNPMTASEYNQLKNFVESRMGSEAVDFLVHENVMSVTPYSGKNPVFFLSRSGEKINILDVEQQILAKSLDEKTEKYHYCFWTPDKFERLKNTKV